jgi:hypothetical protein
MQLCDPSMVIKPHPAGIHIQRWVVSIPDDKTRRTLPSSKPPSPLLVLPLLLLPLLASSSKTLALLLPTAAELKAAVLAAGFPGGCGSCSGCPALVCTTRGGMAYVADPMLGGVLLLLLLPRTGPLPARGTIRAVPSGSAWHAPAAAVTAPAAMRAPARDADMSRSMRPGSALQEHHSGFTEHTVGVQQHYWGCAVHRLLPGHMCCCRQ